MRISSIHNSKRSFFFSVCCLLLSVFSPPAYAEEQITITTYYPAPYGIYREMRTNFIAVGSGYRATAAATTDGGTQDGDAWFSGEVGIGTINPLAPLALNTGTGTYGGIWIGQGAGQAGWIYYGNTATDWKVGKIDTTTNNFEIRRNDDVSFLTVTPGGRLGIGTTTPAGPLQVRASGSSNFIVSNACPGFCFSGPGNATDEIRLYASDGGSTATNLNIVGSNVKLYGNNVLLYGNANTCIRLAYNSNSGPQPCPVGYSITFDPSSIFRTYTDSVTGATITISPPTSGFIICCKFCNNQNCT